MSSSLTPFTFPATSREIRVVEIDGEPWFVAVDVCRELGIANASQAVERIDGDWVSQTEVADGQGRMRSTNLVSEPGLYDLIFRSDKPVARVFRRWVYDEVLPAIRKTGAYAPQLTTAERLLQQAQALVEQERRQVELERQQRELERQQIETRLQVLETAARIDAQQQAIARHDAQLDSLDHRDGCLTILAWWKQRGINGILSISLSASMGKSATAAYRSRFGQEPPKVLDGRYGYVNQYPEDLLDELFCPVLEH